MLCSAYYMYKTHSFAPVEIALIWRGMSGKDERKDVLIGGSSFPSGCYWLIMGLDWSPPSARKRNYFTEQPMDLRDIDQV